MSQYKTITADVEVEVDLDEWDEREIVDYMEDLGWTITKTPEDDIWLPRLADAKQYHPETFDALFSEYVYLKLGRII